MYVFFAAAVTYANLLQPRLWAHHLEWKKEARWRGPFLLYVNLLLFVFPTSVGAIFDVPWYNSPDQLATATSIR